MVARSPAEFVRSTTRLAPVPAVPEVWLHQASDPYRIWELARRERGVLDTPVPYWAFPWAGGQALARYLLDEPETVAGRTVLDIASGSGLVAVAAALAGAGTVVANEIDEDALAAIELNARANAVRVVTRAGDLLDGAGELDDVGASPGTPGAAEMVLAGDTFYDGDTAPRVMPFLHRVRDRGGRVLVGDPDREYLPRTGLSEIARYEVPVSPHLEGREITRARVLTVSAESAPHARVV